MLIDRKINKSWFFLFLYVLLATGFYYLFVGDDYYKNFVEDVSWSIDADSRKYVEFTETDYFEGNSLISVGANFFGPYIILKFFGADHTLIYFFNLALFLWSIILIFNYFSINRMRFLFILAINPMIFFSLLTVNKEITGIFSIVCLVCYYSKRKNKYLILMSLIFAFLTRYQYVAFVLAVLIADVFIKYTGFSRRIVLIGILAVLSFVIPMVSDQYIDVFLGDDVMGEAEKQLGILTLFNNLQNKYLYFLIFIPKVLFNFLSPIYKLLFNFRVVREEFWFNFYNIFVTSFASVACLIIIALGCISRRKLSIKYDEIYITLFMLILFCLTPFAQLRYMLPTYILAAIFLSRKKTKEINNKRI